LLLRRRHGSVSYPEPVEERLHHATRQKPQLS
jgi:hypothetical protein